MEKVEIDLDRKAINDKIIRISELLDGLKVLEICCILGTVIIELVQSARSQGYDINGLFVNWLKRMADGVEKMPEMENDDQ